MNHPKMRYTYVGIDSHKHSHTAVFLDCFFDKRSVITFNNLPSKFPDFLSEALNLRIDGTELLFGLEDASSYGRSLAVFLTDNGQLVKHVNSLLVARERKHRNITVKDDCVDAECAARVLLSKLGELPDVDPDDRFLILRTLVVQRDHVVLNNVRAKMDLHTLLSQHYPNYRDFFEYIDGKTSLAFFKEFPSPATLKGVTLEQLAGFIRTQSSDRFGEEKAAFILASIEDTTVAHQEIRDDAVRSAVRQIEFNIKELQRLETTMEIFLANFNCTLTSMAGIGVVSACQLLSCIGDIKRFPTPAKLARYSGIAPVTYASGHKSIQYANQRGDRELNSLFYALAVRLTSPVSSSRKSINPFFFEYFHRKKAEGKTKRQALKCVERRLVNIVWTMLTYNEEYVNPPVLDIQDSLADKGGSVNF